MINKYAFLIGTIMEDHNSVNDIVLYLLLKYYTVLLHFTVLYLFFISSKFAGPRNSYLGKI